MQYAAAVCVLYGIGQLRNDLRRNFARNGFGLIALATRKRRPFAVTAQDITNRTDLPVS